MFHASQQLDSVPVPVLMAVVWVATVLIVALLIRGIVKAAINKANAQDLAQVLAALAPMLGGLVRTLVTGRKPSAAVPDAQDAPEIIRSGEAEQDG